ncbi:MAG TPA: type I 3-dehydroquinate dehydratase [Candidatus Angelobacter sp.]
MADAVAVERTTFPSRICVSVGHSSAEMMLNLAHIEAERGERFFEFCLEFLNNPQEGPDLVREFLRGRPQTCILVTCRRGDRNLQCSISEQLRLFEAAVVAGARGIDVEIETARHVREWLTVMRHGCFRIVSYHNYQDCPPLEPVLQELESVPADVIKVAVMAREQEAIGRLMLAAHKCRRPNLMLAMGREGLPTRIVAPILGRSFTYASPAGQEGTAAGQPDARTLRETYRLDELDRDTRFLQPAGPWPQERM